MLSAFLRHFIDQEGYTHQGRDQERAGKLRLQMSGKTNSQVLNIQSKQVWKLGVSYMIRSFPSPMTKLVYKQREEEEPVTNTM